MCEISGVQDELRLALQRADLVDRCLQRGGYIRIGGFIKSNMTVADLREADSALVVVRPGLSEEARGGYARLDRPNDPGAGPRHASEKSPAVNSVMILISCDGFFQDCVLSRLKCVRSKMHTPASLQIFPDRSG